jgi:hypothetical protein
MDAPITIGTVKKLHLKFQTCNPISKQPEIKVL